jgi:hypothetical protein
MNEKNKKLDFFYKSGLFNDMMMKDQFKRNLLFLFVLMNVLMNKFGHLQVKHFVIFRKKLH